jgi:hypothetical protein
MMERIARKDNYLWSSDAKISSQKRTISLFVELCAARLQDTNYLKHVKAVGLCPHIAQPLDQGTIR